MCSEYKTPSQAIVVIHFLLSLSIPFQQHQYPPQERQDSLNQLIRCLAMKLTSYLPLLPLFPLSFCSPAAEPNTNPILSLRSQLQLRPSAAYIPGTIETVAQIVSELISIQIVGFATTQPQLQFLCDSFPATRLQQQFYNVTLVREIICAGARESKGQVGGLEPLPLIRNLTTLASTEIWIVQAIGAVQGVSRLFLSSIDSSTVRFAFSTDG